MSSAVCAVVLAAALTGCAHDGTTRSGQAIGGMDGSRSGVGDESATAAGPEQKSGPEVIDQSVDRGRFAGRRQAEAVATLYEQLWTSYHRGRMTPRVARLTTDSAYDAFLETLSRMRGQQQTVGTLSEARVTRVKRDKVMVCMASSSYQRIDVDTGAAVEEAEPGYTEYRVRLKQKGSRGWQIDEVAGFTESACGAAS